MNKVKKLIPIFLTIILLVGCTQNTQNAQNSSPAIERNPIDKTFNEFVDTASDAENDFSNFLTTVSYAGTTLLFDKTNVISDLNEPLMITFGQTGKDRLINFNIFLDYQQIPFRVDENDPYSLNYQFQMKNNEEISFPIYFDDSLTTDNDSHKLLFSFVASPESYSANIEDYEPTNFYGTHFQHNIAFTENYIEGFEHLKEKFTENAPNELLPNAMNALMLNTDFNNAYYLENNGELYKFPETTTVAKKNSPFDMVYFVSNPSDKDDNALIILTLNNIQTKINEEEVFLVQTSPNKTSNGVLTFTPPNEEGLYEVIAYGIPSPFDSENNTLYTSPRFTLKVE